MGWDFRRTRTQQIAWRTDRSSAMSGKRTLDAVAYQGPLCEPNRFSLRSRQAYSCCYWLATVVSCGDRIDLVLPFSKVISLLNLDDRQSGSSMSLVFFRYGSIVVQHKDSATTVCCDVHHQFKLPGCYFLQLAYWDFADRFFFLCNI